MVPIVVFFCAIFYYEWYRRIIEQDNEFQILYLLRIGVEADIGINRSGATSKNAAASLGMDISSEGVKLGVRGESRSGEGPIESYSFQFDIQGGEGVPLELADSSLKDLLQVIDTWKKSVNKLNNLQAIRVIVGDFEELL